jgi:hypothetical protein
LVQFRSEVFLVQACLFVGFVGICSVVIFALGACHHHKPED